MTVTLEISAEKAAVLKAQAVAQGLSVEEWLLELAERHAGSAAGSTTTVADLVLRRMRGIPRDVMEQLPSDGASQHDHYLYGTPKVQS